MAHDYQTRQDDGSWYWVTMHRVASFFEHVIICSLVTNKKRCISNFTSPMDIKLDGVVMSPMDIKLDRVVAYNLVIKLKKSYHSK